MKYIISLFIIFYLGLSHANDESCSPQILDLSDLEKIECEILKNDNIALKKNHCKKCHISKPFLNPNYRKEIAKKQIVTDLKNSVFVVITEIFKMGQVSGYSPNSCGVQGMKAAFKNKQSCLKQNDNLIQIINQSITTEIANFTIKGENYLNEEGITPQLSKLKKSCPVSHADLQTNIVKSIESRIDSKDLENLAKISLGNKNDYKKILIQFRSEYPNSSLNIDKHPIIRELILKKPDEVLKNIDKLQTSEQIKKFLYNKENIKLLSESANQHCNKLYENFANAICDEDVNSGNTQISNFKDFEDTINKDFENNPKINQYTKELFCSQFYTPTEQVSTEPKNISDLSKSIRSMNDGYDVVGSIGLEILKPMEEQIAPYCAEYCKNNSCGTNVAEAGTSKIPKETSNILKDLFDFKAPMSEEKKKIFIQSELLTQAEATSVLTEVKKEDKASTPSPFIPEKEKQIFGKTNSFASANLNNTPMTNSSYSPSSYSSSSQYTEETISTTKERVLPPSTAEYLKQMSSMNRELLDRLVKERGAKEKYSNDEIKQQIAKLSKERNLPLSPDQQAQFFDHEWSEAAPKVMPLIPEELKAKEKNSDRYAASISAPLTGKALQDKKYQDQRNKALEQFGKGATDSTPVTDASAVVMSVNNELLLKKVRLDVPDDKIEKLNLSVILDQKLGADKEGKKLKGLIDNKQSFMLDIEGQVAFMVEYSEAKKGFDLKTLKNNLPPEVFEKIKTQLSQFLSKNDRKHEYSALKEELKN